MDMTWGDKPWAPDSLLARLEKLPDPRRRQARVYPLAGILGMLILAALHGETSLRGMWIWCQARSQLLIDSLGFWAVRRLPALVTIWNLLSELDVEAFEEAILGWGQTRGETEGVISVDGKMLRGSKRDREAALQVVTAVSQQLGVILQQSQSSGNEMEAAIRLLGGLPLEGKVVTADAGLFKRRFVETVVEKKGATSAC
jgi:hypothetical protein